MSPRFPAPADVPLEVRVGQLFHVGFDGTEPTDAVASLIRDAHVGGVIYFSRNVESARQARELGRTLQGIAADATPPIPLLISVDQEGGPVRRLREEPSLPSAMAVGATSDPSRAGDVAAVTAARLRRAGIDWNLTPVVDVNSDPANPVIGRRAFGELPERVAAFGGASVEALQSAGVAACVKHFPGHGRTVTDSHVDLPVVDADVDRLARVDLPPFERAIDAGVDAVMASHVAFPAFTGSRSRPATLSPAVLTGLLRDRLGFEGVIATDCMEMDAIADHIGTVQGTVEAIWAGADAVFVSHTPSTQRAAVDAVVDAVEAGEIPTERIDDAYARVRALKRRRLGPTSDAGGGSASGLPSDPRSVPEPESERRRDAEIIRAVHREAITLVADDGDRLPLSRDRPLQVFAATPSAGGAVDRRSAAADTVDAVFTDRGFDADVLAMDEAPPLDESPITDCSQVLCCTADVRDHPEQATFVESLQGIGCDPIVAAVCSPYDRAYLPPIGTYLTTYGVSHESLDALASVLSGDRRAAGRVLPSLR